MRIERQAAGVAALRAEQHPVGAGRGLRRRNDGNEKEQDDHAEAENAGPGHSNEMQQLSWMVLFGTMSHGGGQGKEKNIIGQHKRAAHFRERPRSTGGSAYCFTA